MIYEIATEIALEQKSLDQIAMFTGLFEGATSNRAELCYNNIQARVLIPSTPIYTKKKHLEEDPSRSGSFY
jgi:hypothetical protein